MKIRSSLLLAGIVAALAPATALGRSGQAGRPECGRCRRAGGAGCRCRHRCRRADAANAAKDAAADASAATKDAMADAAGKAADKAQDLADAAKDKAGEAKDAAEKAKDEASNPLRPQEWTAAARKRCRRFRIRQDAIVACSTSAGKHAHSRNTEAKLIPGKKRLGRQGQPGHFMGRSVPVRSAIVAATAAGRAAAAGRRRNAAAKGLQPRDMRLANQGQGHCRTQAPHGAGKLLLCHDPH
jgi:hypothetical protein